MTQVIEEEDEGNSGDRSRGRRKSSSCSCSLYRLCSSLVPECFWCTIRYKSGGGSAGYASRPAQPTCDHGSHPGPPAPRPPPARRVPRVRTPSGSHQDDTASDVGGASCHVN